MKAIVIGAPGEISLREAPRPERKENEVLIRVLGMGICGSDIAAYKGINPLVTYPRIIGHEIAGEVLELPRGETDLSAGDRVVIEPCVYCGRCYPCLNGRTNCCENLTVRGVHIEGGMSELCSHPRRLIHRVPADVTWTRLAMVEPLTISVHAVKRVRLVKGEHLVVTGAGPIGLLAAQYALVIGAVPIVVDPIDERLAFARSLGILHGINPARENAVERIREITGGRMAEAVIEASGSDAAVRSAVDYVAYSGRIALVGWPKGDVLLTTALFTKKELDVMGSRNSVRNFSESIDLVAGGKIDVASLVTRTVSFEEVPEAVRAIAATPKKFMKVVALAP
ncbi:MAG: zinc-binding alcohol dehydrogenase family protein [Deltaproteobacteria bacterium]|nr:zinc-binding alcohol dehydrogenase family protein [Deltaproteobacteria bacterium]